MPSTLIRPFLRKDQHCLLKLTHLNTKPIVITIIRQANNSRGLIKSWFNTTYFNRGYIYLVKTSVAWVKTTTC
jgi:hypothetical protein